MRLSAPHKDNLGKGRIPAPVWWASYLVVSLWAQELSGGHDFLSPGLLICLQTGQWWSAVWVTLIWVLVQEGIGNLVFGVALLFYAGVYGFFLLSRWLLEPENPLFVILFSLVLAIWAWVVLSGAVAFQELPVRLPSQVPWIARQWGAYVLCWSVAMIVYRKWCRHGRV